VAKIVLSDLLSVGNPTAIIVPLNVGLKIITTLDKIASHNPRLLAKQSPSCVLANIPYHFIPKGRLEIPKKQNPI
jgi:hypothetical protein